MRNSGQQLPGIDDVKIGQKTPTGEIEMDFTKMKSLDGDPPMVGRDVKGFQDVAEMNDAIIVVRKGNEAGLDVIQNHTAHPKPMEIKAKSINEYDRMLGFDEVPAINGRGTNEGLVSCKRPKLPDDFNSLSHGDRSELLSRYTQRMDEFENLGPELKQMRDAGKIEWDPETGIIRNAKDGKPFSGDNDPFMYLDPDTGQTLNPYRTNTVNSNLQQNGQTLHNGHANWDYSGYQKSNTGKFDQFKDIDGRILKGHQDGGLVAYNPRTGKWYELDWGGSTTRDYGKWNGVGGK